MIALLLCLVFAVSLISPGSAQAAGDVPPSSLPPIPVVPSLAIGCETSGDLQRCFLISDFSATGHSNPVSGQDDIFLHTILADDGWVEFQVHWSESDGNQSRTEINQGYHKIPAGGTITDWSSDQFEPPDELGFLVQAQLLSPHGSTDNWKTGEVPDWHEAVFSLKPTWNATEPLEANRTSLLATAGLVHLSEDTNPVNLSLVHSDGDWEFTIDPENGELAMVPLILMALLDAEPGEHDAVVLVFAFYDPGQAIGDIGSTKGKASEIAWHVEGHLPGRPTPPLDGSDSPESAQYALDTVEEGYDTATADWPKQLPIPRVEMGPFETGPVPVPQPPDLVLREDDQPPPPDQPANPLDRIRAPSEDRPAFHDGPDEENVSAEPPVAWGGGGEWRGSSSPGGNDASGLDESDPSLIRVDPVLMDSGPDDQGGPDIFPSAAVEGRSLPVDPVTLLTVLVGAYGVGVAFALAVRPEGMFVRWLARISSGGVFLGLFSRATGPAVLKYPLRARIHDLISREPGITLSTLVAQTDVNRSTLRHHLRVLEREGLVHSRSRSKSRHFYAQGQKSVPQNESPARNPLLYQHRATLAKSILRRPGQAQKQLAKNVGLPPSRVHNYARDLKKADLIHMQREGKFIRYFPSEALQRMEEGLLSDPL